MTAHEETKTFDSASGEAGGLRAHLLVIHGVTSFLHPLPNAGVVLVGRAPEADLRIDVPSISRRHAKFMVVDGEISVSDMDSHNGTRVNGERIAGSRTLASGDLVAMGDLIFILRCEPRGDGRQILDLKQARQRLSEEIERARDYSRHLSVLAVSLGEAFLDRAAAGASAVTALRLMDVIAWAGASQMLVLLPELAGEAARSAGLHVIEALAPLAAGVKGGLACYPADGCDADTLISVARTAVDVAPPGAVGAAADAVVRHAIGDRSIVVADPAMIHLFNLIRRLAGRDMPILVLGETGTGKESAASALHYWSPRAGKPFVSLNCATLPESLVESELFGYEKGAFSDAKAPKPGLLEEANGGTLFLDEVGELPEKVQAKLLRVLETRRITRLGALREREIDVRVVAATNRDLAAESHAGRFRSDLFFRLNAGCVNLPPLRLRPREIVILARMFLAEERARFDQPPVDLSEASLRVIASYPWPGNVRELKNAMAWAATMASEGPVEPWDLPASIGDRGQEPAEQKEAEQPPPSSAQGPSPRARSLAEEVRRLEIARMEEALDAAGGVQVRAAAILGMPLRTFAYKQKQFGIALKSTRRRT